MYSAAWTVRALAIALICTAARCENDCRVSAKNLAASGVETANLVKCMVDPCDMNSNEVPDSNTCPSHCFSRNGKCYQKELAKRSGGPSVDARLFGLGGNQFGGNGPLQGILPPFVPVNSQCPTFPNNCGYNSFNADWTALMNPPVNIPYCQRTPCSSSDVTLETDATRCFARPGCYYDSDLAFYRQSFGSAILPGVPVCHKVIRNNRFHQLVNKYLKSSNQPWNALHTNCLIQQNIEEIHEQPAGCYMVNVFMYMGIKPKYAGWKGITKTECSLIGACFDQTIGCFFPAELNQIAVRSGNDPFRNGPDQQSRYIFGQPLCQPLDLNWSPERFLDAYHSCRLSGCVVDPIVTDGILKQHLYNITVTQVPQHLQYRFWAMVQNNEISADNWRFELNRLRRQFPKNNPLSQVASNPINLLALTLALRGNQNSIVGGRSYNPNQAASSNSSKPRFGSGFPGGAGLFPPNTGFPQMPGSPSVFPGGFPTPGAGFPQPGLTNPFQPVSPFQPGFPGPVYRPQCPFSNVFFTGYPQLKGSLEGCCERNLCYVPRNQISFQRSGVSNYMSNWETWGECSQSCGGGVRKRVRRCVAYKRGSSSEDECTQEEETEACGNVDCPYFGGWGTWGGCTHTCGDNGFQYRQRECKPSGSTCSGNGQEKRSCNRGACPTLSAWGRYGDCSVRCGVGERNRTRTCTSGGAFGCESLSDPLIEYSTCEIFCGSKVVLRRGECDMLRTCRRRVEWACQYAGNDTPHCSDFKPITYENCCSFLG